MGLARSGEAYFSPDGKQVCFQAYPTGRSDYQIYVMHVDGSGLKVISTGQGATTCSFFHPDGKRVLFASNHLDQRPPVPPELEAQSAAASPSSRYKWDVYPGMDLFEYTLATGTLKQLTKADGYDAEGSYSPDGKSIVFTSMRDGDREIYICDADGSNPRRITYAKGYDGGPFFSPGGERIVYRSDRKGDGNMQIFVNNLEGTSEKAVTGGDVLHWCPYWHPSGKWLIFTHADHGTAENPKRPNYDLYLVRDDGSQTIRVTSDEAFDGLPVFSPDGKRLMWTSKRGGLAAPQIFVADFVGLTPEGELAR
jgi:Tol biopolymer transport system component